MPNMSSDFEAAADALLFTDEISFKTKGRSMEPLFREHRDIVNIRTVSRKLKRGDVVLYPDDAGIFLILHRVIKDEGETLLIRGDNNYFDEHRYKDEIVGVMTSFFRKGKYCDIEKSTKYRLYTFCILNSYPIRRFYQKKLRPILSKIKRFILRKKPTQ